MNAHTPRRQLQSGQLLPTAPEDCPAATIATRLAKVVSRLHELGEMSVSEFNSAPPATRRELCELEDLEAQQRRQLGFVTATSLAGVLAQVREAVGLIEADLVEADLNSQPALRLQLRLLNQVILALGTMAAVEAVDTGCFGAARGMQSALAVFEQAMTPS